jgi:hypothetical protein
VIERQELVRYSGMDIFKGGNLNKEMPEMTGYQSEAVED